MLKSSASDILDTFKIQTDGIALKEFHIERSWEALTFLGLAPTSDHKSQLEQLYSKIERKNPAGCYRLILHAQTYPQYTLERRELDSLPTTIRLAPQTDSRPAEALDRFKWNSRERWASLNQHLPEDADDILLLTPTGHLKETSRFNVFCFSASEGYFYTPTLAAGCLNGVFRRAVLKNKALSPPDSAEKYPVYEKDLTLSEALEMQVFVGNAVRGLLSAKIL